MGSYIPIMYRSNPAMYRMYINRQRMQRMRHNNIISRTGIGHHTSHFSRGGKRRGRK